MAFPWLGLTDDELKALVLLPYAGGSIIIINGEVLAPKQ